MLVNLKEITALAEEKRIAVGAFNAVSLASMKAVIRAAEEMQQPVVLQFAQVHSVFNRIDDLAPLMLKYATNACVPVCVHLDHGEDLDFVKKALDLGFTGVMFDGSKLPLEQNYELSTKAVEMANEYGAGVEAELGSMGRTEDGTGIGTGSEDETKIYTDPSLAKDFVAQTGIDALACSFGTTHGIYLKEPKLDFTVVDNVRRECGGIPVVMHGGSGVSEEDYGKAIDSGVRKINYFTYMDKAGAEAVRNYLTGHEKDPLFTAMTFSAEEAMKENVKNAIRIFSRIK